MINPHMLKTTSKRQNSPMFAGGKYYLPVIHGSGYVRATRRTFKRASEALSYADRARERWGRLHDAASVRMLEPSPEKDEVQP